MCSDNFLFPLGGVDNSRQLGGIPVAGDKKVKSGVLFRTAALSRLTPAAAEKIISANIKYVVDFRSVFEAAKAPDISVEGVKYVNAEVFRFAYEDDPSFVSMRCVGALSEIAFLDEQALLDKRLYTQILSKPLSVEGYKKFFSVLLSMGEGEGVIFHCSGGKDRTGIAAMLILTALGASKEDIIKDYLLTNSVNAALIAETKKLISSLTCDESVVHKATVVRFAVDKESILEAYACLEAEYGSVENYLRSAIGLTDSDFRSLRAKFCVVG